jgi:hypothetical protein
MNQFQKDLVESNINLAYSVMHKLGMTPTPDTRQEAMLALCMAANSFDPTKGSNFSTWAALKVRGHLLNLMGTQQKHRNREPIKDQYWHESVADPHYRYGSRDMVDHIEALVEVCVGGRLLRTELKAGLKRIGHITGETITDQMLTNVLRREYPNCEDHKIHGDRVFTGLRMRDNAVLEYRARLLTE